MQVEEIIFFGLVMTFSGFLVGYITDFITGREINWIPSHSVDMATGTFFTSVIVYILFSKKYFESRCKKLKLIQDTDNISD